MYMYTALSSSYMHDELSAGTDVSIIPTYHAQSHGIISSLRDILHLLQRCLEVGGGEQPGLEGAALQVSEEELVLTDPLDRLDEEGVNALSLFELHLNILCVCVCVCE